jgi:hypothetical protein
MFGGRVGREVKCCLYTLDLCTPSPLSPDTVCPEAGY